MKRLVTIVAASLLLVGCDQGKPRDKVTVRERMERETPVVDVNAPPRVASLKIEHVPVVVRLTIEREAAGRNVADIDRESWNGKTVYEIEFTKDGRNAQFYVAEDGTIIKPEQGSSLAGMQASGTPRAVQRTIEREGKGLEIADIDKERRNGRAIYEVEFKKPGGNILLHIAEDGTIQRKK